MSKHTPGPWIADVALDQMFKESPGLEIFSATKTKIGDNQFIANIGALGQSKEEKKANANLISAAPEMLEALELVVKRLTGDIQADIKFDTPFDSMAFRDLIDSCKIAIAKARGEE